jgi:hypothetical protein
MLTLNLLMSFNWLVKLKTLILNIYKHYKHYYKDYYIEINFYII